jgi:transketolase
MKMENTKQDVKTDFTAADLEKVRLFKEAGMPGVGAINQSMIERMTDLYLSGKSYAQISQNMRLKRDIILFLADKFHWYALKNEAVQELEKTLQIRAKEYKRRAPAFLLDLIQYLQNEMADQISKSLASGHNGSGSLNLKMIGQYIKALEALNKMIIEPSAQVPVERKADPKPLAYNLMENDESLGDSFVDRVANFERRQEAAVGERKERLKANNG